MYSGTIVPLITPLDEGGVVDQSSVDRLVDHVRDEVTALMPTLSSGEGDKLSARQWCDMVVATLACARGLPVLAGILLPQTREVVERARLARSLGVAAVVVSTPFDPDLDQDQIYRHYERVREAVDIPLFVYNEAAKSGNTVELETLLRIFRLPGVVGVKESSGDAALTRDIVAADHDVPVFEGWENLMLEARGVAGFIGPLANIEPGICTAMLDEPSAERQHEIDELSTRFGIFEDDWYRHVKAELRTRGIIGCAATVEEVGEQ